MEIISQHTKQIMEECKSRARDAGLVFDSETIEYIVTNHDMIELGSKHMIPTLYDYWVHDLHTIKEKKQYEIFPHNAYETVINSRPALSFYNDNNPDWLNVMIFYHVLAHIDFMQNNQYFKHTWDDDFVGQALADKRLIDSYRTEHGRWVDYVIEFSRSIDNIIGYYPQLNDINNNKPLSKVDYFFDIFIQNEKKLQIPQYLKYLDEYNKIKKIQTNNMQADNGFLSQIKDTFPEFDTHYKKYIKKFRPKDKDVMEYIMNNSMFLNKDENKWMKDVIQIVRNTSAYFAPQIRTKIMNEGWASYWHEKLFLMDDRIKGHEADFAKVNAQVTAVPKLGLNPYAIGMRMFYHIEQQIDCGKMSHDFDLCLDREERKKYDKNTGKGLDALFDIRTNYCDFNFVNKFITQDFVDQYNLVIIGEKIDIQRMVRQWYIKSKKANDYKQMIIDEMIHPPHITVDPPDDDNDDFFDYDGSLVLRHHHEGKRLVPEFIDNVLIGLQYLWGDSIELHTSLVKKDGTTKPITYIIDGEDIITEEGLLWSDEVEQLEDDNE